MAHIDKVRAELIAKIAKSKSESRTIRLEKQLKHLKTIEKRSYNAVFQRDAKKTVNIFTTL